MEATQAYKESEDKGQYLKQELQNIRVEEAMYRAEQAKIAEQNREEKLENLFAAETKMDAAKPVTPYVVSNCLEAEEEEWLKKVASQGAWATVKTQEEAKAAAIAGSTSLFEKSLSEKDLVNDYQQHQGNTNYCASYSISTGLNLLYGTQTTGNDVREAFILNVNWFENPGRYSELPDGSAATPYQQANIIRNFSSTILRQSTDLPNTEVRELTPDEMRVIILDPNKVALFTYNTESGKILSGHVVVLVAYDANTGQFGFLNSGAERNPNRLTWKTEAEIEAYLQDPIGVSSIYGENEPHFTIISK